MRQVPLVMIALIIVGGVYAQEVDQPTKPPAVEEAEKAPGSIKEGARYRDLLRQKMMDEAKAAKAKQDVEEADKARK
jgi:hypothetical protein